jgi:hypothetical protein
MGLLVVGHREARSEKEHYMAFEVRAKIAFQPGEIGCGHVHLHRMIVELIQVDVTNLVILTEHPEPVLFIQAEGQDIVVGDGAGIILPVAIEEEAPAIIAFHASHGADPYITFRVLFDGSRDVGGQSVADTQMGEEVLLLGVEEGAEHQEQADEEGAI